jgi:hypothetical protein
MIGKRGDGNWFIISLIIVVLTLVVIIGIFISLNSNTDVDRTVCKESLLARAALPEKVGISVVKVSTDLKDMISVACKTKRICVTAQPFGDQCEKELGSNYAVNRVLSSDLNTKKDKIRMLMAREMADCHSMTGESNMQIFNRETTMAKENAKGIICSRIYFDSSITKDISELTGLSSYLLTHAVPGKEVSYWDYLRNTVDGDTLAVLQGNPVSVGDRLDLTKQKAVFYLEMSPSQMGEVIGGVAGAVGATALLGSFGGAGSKALGFLGMGIDKQLLVVGGAGLVGANIGDTVWSTFFNSEYEGKPSVGGVFLTDYTPEGFASLKDKNLEFYNIA